MVYLCVVIVVLYAETSKFLESKRKALCVFNKEFHANKFNATVVIVVVVVVVIVVEVAVVT